jgi:outer membrane immunogenic protein
MLRSFIVGAVSALALSSAADAADMYRAEGPGGYKDGPYVPVATWTGFYVGVNGGYAFSGDSRTIEITNNGTVVDRVPGAQNEGAFGGGQIGYNISGGRLGLGSRVVLGIEADIQGADISDDYRFVPANGVSITRRGTSSVDYFGTVRGRVGYGFDRTLVYATGGLAYGNVTNRLYDSGNALVYKSDELQTGYAVGGGIEHLITPGWSVKLEYQYVNLGDEKLKIQPGFVQTFGTRDVETDFHTIRVGLNYHVGSTYEPLK